MKRIAALGIVLTLAGAAVFAKGPTTRIRVQGGSLPASIDLTDPAFIKAFSIWTGGGTFVNYVEETEGFIIDWTAGAMEPPAALPTYTISFFTVPPREKSEQLTYVVKYARDPASGQGFVYLPGPSDAGYSINFKRAGWDGHWYRATSRWDAALQAVVAHR